MRSDWDKGNFPGMGDSYSAPESNSGAGLGNLEVSEETDFKWR